MIQQNLVPNFHNGYLAQGQQLGAVTYQYLLNANNLVLPTFNATLILLQSDDTTATNRVFTINSTTLNGMILTLMYISGSSNTCKLANSGNMALTADWTPTQYQTLQIQWNGTVWQEVSRSNVAFPGTVSLTSAHILVGNGSNIAADVAVSGDLTLANTGAFTIANLAVTNAKVSASAAIDFSKLATLTSGNILVGSAGNVATSVAMSGDATMIASGAVTIAPTISVYTAVVSLSQSDITGLSVTPKVLVAAPGVGKVILVDEVQILHTYSTTQYANGGFGQILYHGAATIMEFAGSVFTAASSGNFFLRPNLYDIDASTGTAPQNLAAQANLGIDLTNLTAPFINGNAANVIKVQVKYRVVTLLT